MRSRLHLHRSRAALLLSSVALLAASSCTRPHRAPLQLVPSVELPPDPAGMNGASPATLHADAGLVVELLPGDQVEQPGDFYPTPADVAVAVYVRDSIAVQDFMHRELRRQHEGATDALGACSDNLHAALDYVAAEPEPGFETWQLVLAGAGVAVVAGAVGLVVGFFASGSSAVVVTQ